MVEYDPSIDPSNANAKQDRMSDFNKETRGVQDALKMVEGVTLPSLNIKTWLAINVKSVPLPGEEGAAGEAKRNIQVMIGEEGDEKERIEKARLAESQRYVDCNRVEVRCGRATLVKETWRGWLLQNVI